VSYTSYYPSGWKDWPDVTTPLTAAALTHIESGISNVSNQEITLRPTGGGDSAQVNAAIVQAAAQPYGATVTLGDYGDAFSFDAPVNPLGPTSGSGRVTLNIPQGVKVNRAFAGGSLIVNSSQSVKVNNFAIVGNGSIGDPNALGGITVNLYGDNIILGAFTVDTYSGGVGFWLGGDNMRMFGTRAINPAQKTGVGGVRFLTGRGFRAFGLYVESGDDTFQFVPEGNSSGPLYNAGDIVDGAYIGCTGRSYAARLYAVALQRKPGQGPGGMTVGIRNVRFIGCGGNGGIRAMVGLNYDSTQNIETVHVLDSPVDMALSSNLVITGGITSGSPTMTGISADNINQIFAGDKITGDGIPGSTTVSSVDVANLQLTLSANATATETTTATINGSGANIMLRASSWASVGNINNVTIERSPVVNPTASSSTLQTISLLGNSYITNLRVIGGYWTTSGGANGAIFDLSNSQNSTVENLVADCASAAVEGVFLGTSTNTCLRGLVRRVSFQNIASSHFGVNGNAAVNCEIDRCTFAGSGSAWRTGSGGTASGNRIYGCDFNSLPYVDSAGDSMIWGNENDSAIPKWWAPGYARATLSSQLDFTNTASFQSLAMTVPVQANATYRVRMRLLVTGDPNADIVARIDGPSGATWPSDGWLGQSTTATAAQGASSTWNANAESARNANTTSSQNFGLISGNTTHVDFEGVVAVGSTSGTLTPKVEQNVQTNATQCLVLANSWIEVQRIA
jgi:hypothetical protein